VQDDPGQSLPDPRELHQAPKVETSSPYDEYLDTLDRARDPRQVEPKLKAPELKAPIDLRPNTGVNKGPLVSVNKSGVTPQVLSLPKGNGTVQGLGLTFQTNLQTGSASLSIPFTVPPARRGLGPALGLGYSSGGGQSVSGLGWSFDVGFIALQTDQGLPRYDGTDRYVYNGGQELVRVQPGTEALPTWADPDHYYRSKLEGLFMRFFLLGAGTGSPYWVAQDRDGTLYYFGGTGSAMDHTALVADEVGERIFRWNLVRVVDVFGNEVRYGYEKDEGQSYLVDVRYNLHPTSGRYQHRVVVEYETRSDVLTTYQTGYGVTTAWRVREVRVFTDYGPGAERLDTQPDDGDGRLLVRSYLLEYMPSQLHSLLESVRLFGKDGVTGLPPATFEYSEVDGALEVPELGRLSDEVLPLGSSPEDSLGDGRRDLLDVDADGLPDVFETDPTNPGSVMKYYLNAGASLPGSGQGMAGAGGLYLYNTNVHLVDLDGDGFVELVHMPHLGSYSVYRLQCDAVPTGGSGASRTCRWVASDAVMPANPDIDFTTDAAEIRLLDVNGDHLIDVVRTTGTRMEHWLNLSRHAGGEGKFGHVTASGALSTEPIASCVLHKGLPVAFSDSRVKLADVNGDGLEDLVQVDQNQFAYWPNRGHGVWGLGGDCPGGQFGANRYVSVTLPPDFQPADITKVHLGDVNGDGLADLIQVRADAVDVWLNAITHFKPRAIVEKSPWAPGFTDRVRLADVNGSGSRDVLWGDGGGYRYVDLTGGIKARLLTKVHNGLGGVTEIDYEQSTDQYLRDREEGREWQSVCPFPSQIVKEVRTRDQFDQVPGWTEGVTTVKYRYRDCYYDGKEHESRGFAWAEEEHVGDANGPTSYTDHWFHQGREDEALAGREYRTETWAYGSGTTKTYLSTSWTGYAVRTILTPHADDTAPGMAADPGRSVRFAYAAESHSLGYDTNALQSGITTQAGMLRWRSEGPGGSGAVSRTVDVTLPVGSGVTHFLGTSEVDDFARPTTSRAHGRVGSNDPVIARRATYAADLEKWIHRPCESWVESDGVTYQRKLEFYQGGTSQWIGSCQGGGSTCSVGDLGLSTRGEYEECFEYERVRLVEEHATEYTRWGLPRHTRALKKQEGWLYYEEPTGYQALATREVIRVGTDRATADYPETAVKYLTTRAKHDPGLGAVVEYRDHNDQKSQAVYDALGRLTELWGPREPGPACPGVTFMKGAEITYALVPGGKPYSYVHARTFEDACDPTVVKVGWSYVDGLGRTRLTVTEGEANPVDEQTGWIATGYATFNTKGAAQESYPPAFIGWNPGASPQPLVASCPGTDEIRCTQNPICPVQTTYDAFGRGVSQLLADGTFTRTEYRGPLTTASFDGNDTDGTSPFAGTPTIARKDGHGRVYEVEASYVGASGGTPVSHFTSYFFDPVGNLLVLATTASGNRPSLPPDPTTACGVASSGDLIVKCQTFDSLGQRREIQDPDAGVWRFVYDESGNLVESTDGKWNAGQGGSQIGYEYDTANRILLERCMACERKPAGTILVRYFYDSPSRLVGGRGYLPADIEGGTEPQDWVLGRLARVEDETGVVYQSYDRLGRQVTEVQRIAVTLNESEITGPRPYYIGRIAYDDAGRVVKKTYPAAEAGAILEVEHRYERRGMLAQISGPDPLNQGATYDYLTVSTHNAAGQRCGYVYGDASQIQQTRAFDRLGRLKVATATQLGDPGYPLQNSVYEYDRASNVTAIRDLRDATEVEEYTGGQNHVHDRVLTYDSFYRLVKASYEKDGDVRREMRFSYNAIGNLTERSTTNAAGLVNPQEEFYEKWLGEMTYAPSRPHAFSSAGSGSRRVGADYDANGNMISLEVVNADENRNVRFEYEWDHYDRLVRVEKLESGVTVASADYVYDSAGQRVVKSEQRSGGAAQDTVYVTEGFEIRNEQYERFVFDGSQRIARIGVARPSQGLAEVTRFVMVGDHLGSTSVVVRDEGDSGCVVGTTSHLPYGGIEAESGPVMCAGGEGEEWYRFTGKELEAEFGIYYFGARFLNPALGQFLSVDRYQLAGISQAHPYLYTDGRPYNYNDPSGNDPEPVKEPGDVTPLAGPPPELPGPDPTPGEVRHDAEAYVAREKEVEQARKQMKDPTGGIEKQAIEKPTIRSDDGARTPTAQKLGRQVRQEMAERAYRVDRVSRGAPGVARELLDAARSLSPAPDPSAIYHAINYANHAIRNGDGWEKTQAVLMVGMMCMSRGKKGGGGSPRATRRQTMREAGIPTSQQPVGQTSARAPGNQPAGRQYTYEVPAAGGGTRTMSVQHSLTDRVPGHGSHWEAGPVKPGGQTDSLGRPRLTSDKVKVDE
jgi:RHS repeat-associated protein